MLAPKISVVTPSFNSLTTIRETIESVRRQDYPHWEHIVMDGGSTDGTPATTDSFTAFGLVSARVGRIMMVAMANSSAMSAGKRSFLKLTRAHDSGDTLALIP